MFYILCYIYLYYPASFLSATHTHTHTIWLHFCQNCAPDAKCVRVFAGNPGTRWRRVETWLCTSNFLLEEGPMCRGSRMQNSNRHSRCVLALVTTLWRERYRTTSRFDFEAREIVSRVSETTGAACVTDEGYGLRFSVDEEQARNITGRGQNLNVNSIGWKNDGSSGFFLLLHFLCSLFALSKKLGLS